MGHYLMLREARGYAEVCACCTWIWLPELYVDRHRMEEDIAGIPDCSQRFSREGALWNRAELNREWHRTWRARRLPDEAVETVGEGSGEGPSSAQAGEEPPIVEQWEHEAQNELDGSNGGTSGGGGWVSGGRVIGGEHQEDSECGMVSQ